MIDSKWINIKFFNDTGKTKIYEITTKDDKIILGYIKWFGRWRCYSLFPEPKTVFEKTCLIDITNFISKLMQERKDNVVSKRN